MALATLQVTSVEKEGGRNTLKLKTLQQLESENVQAAPSRAAHDPEPPEEAGAAAGEPPVAGLLDPVNAGLLDPVKAGFLDPLVAGVLVCAEAHARVERMNAVKIIVVLKVINNRKIERFVVVG